VTSFTPADGLFTTASPDRRRLGVSAVVPRGALTAGQGQWLGVAVSPLHDVLTGAQLRLSLAQHGSPAYGGATNYAGVVSSPVGLPIPLRGIGHH